MVVRLYIHDFHVRWSKSECEPHPPNCGILSGGNKKWTQKVISAGNCCSFKLVEILVEVPL